MDDAGTHNQASLTSGRLLVRNVIWNGIGEAGPLVAAVVAMPILVHHLGTERFGVLALAWTVFGYFTLFDLQISRALTKFISDLLGAQRDAEVPVMFWTGFALIGALGAVGGLLFASICPLLVRNVLRIPPALQQQTIEAFYLMAIGLPFAVSSGALNSVLEAYQHFDLSNLVRSPNAIISSLGPLVVLPFSHSIAAIVAVLLVNLIATWVAYFLFSVRAAPRLLKNVRFEFRLVRGLVGFGGWETATNLFGGLTHTVDRFLIAAMVSIGAVSFYVVPARILAKLHVVHGFVCSVLYPAFAHSLVENPERTRTLFQRGTKFIVLLVFPIVLTAVVFARELLTVWMGASFASRATVVLQLLALSVVVDAIGGIAGTLVSASHRPDINAKIHAVLLPIYLGFAILMIQWYGVEGAATACLARACVDSLAHWVSARMVLPSQSGRLSLRLACFLAAAFACMTIAVLPLDLEAKALMVAAAIASLYAGAWLQLLNQSDREAIHSYLSGLRAPPRVKIAGIVE
jgi:O-antigen/teichoic acid export membrane protein